MGTKLLVSNLPLDLDASDLEDMFNAVGDVRVASVDSDERTGGSKGVGRVEMSNASQAQDGIELFNGKSTRGHVLAVREDKPHVPMSGRPEKLLGRTARTLGRKAR